ncbi:MAG: hypothetical protein GX638_11810 [Crenarchaeota archaeon]|nr:hypothetical protein [Thermoproteota archaeon]
MAKFYGVIGYAKQVERSPGVWVDEIVEKTYRGDIVLNQQRWQTSENFHENINIDNSISIIADEYLYNNIGFMKYIQWNGTKWKIQSIAFNRPRVVLQIGGIYNG